jgi:hypothetical protein
VNCFMLSAILLYMVVVIETTVMYIDYTYDTTEPIDLSAVKDDPKYTITDAQVPSFSFESLYHHIDCSAHAANENKPMYTAAMWQHLIQKYTEVTGHRISLEPQPQSTFYIGRSEGAGRGVFASRDIAKGEIIPFDATDIVVTFDDGELWKKLVVSLPRSMACDVMEWSWTQDVFTEGNTKLCLSIGDGDSFLNNGDNDEGTVTIAPTNMTSLKWWAVKDIKEGEELAFDYEVFEPTRWDMFGL